VAGWAEVAWLDWLAGSESGWPGWVEVVWSCWGGLVG
jgi:hypothetical protein